MEDDKVAKPVVGDVPMEEGGKDVKEAKKKEKKENPKNAKKAERQLARQMEAAAVQEVVDPLAANYGEVELVTLQSATQSGRKWIKVSQLDQELKGQTVLVRGRVHAVRGKGKMAFLVVRESGYTVQCLASIAENIVSKQMLKFISGLNKESIIDVEGEVSVPPGEIAGTSQQVEIQIRKLFCVSKALPSLPLTLEDASRSELDFEKAEKEGKQYVKVGQDTRLNNRVLDLRTPCNQAVFRVQSHVSMLFREYLVSEDFVEVHTPKLMAGASEGGSSVFTLDYKGQPACLAQSPQLHKQMGICADFGRVFEIGPVFRAENSFTHRHLCEFTGLDLEMEIKEHYFEVIDLLDKLFVHIFDGLNSKCKKELEAINQQYPFEPLKEAGTIVDPMGDLNTESEKKLGQLVKDKYDTDFYILHRYPLAVRPFYTMPCADDPRYTNSFDVFIRGEEIISGAQRVHDVDLLTKRAIECGIDVKSLSTYIDSFRYGVVPHGGLGVGLERVVMLFCALGNIRKTSMFPRDPQRLTP
ncbi:hypothetical protein AXG93_4486s1000 [Marchantia polymorpha subsp. ruderalis]|uniref:aspartate--tRNA ligase n=1 Tax=Marchantia polymorpha subsp. ruderalis TaxID=1480154 RepID=A0A176W929_MARPO|nr:hypothetical protein AXG93_4486s1000 [Marchantia polymorpha subsp. ruderalis]